MSTLHVDLGSRSYPITIDAGILPDIGSALSRCGFSRTIALVSNETVYPLYGKIVSGSLTAAGFNCCELVLPDGEEFKTLSSAEKITDFLLSHRLDRKSALVALGGGVIGDLAGFAASIFMRGIDFIQIPTTLLAQVDSSVGGKTGVNRPLGKNMIGTFWQPRLVWIDIETLRTLPPREFSAGIAEIIKYGVIHDPALFAFLEENVRKVLSQDREALRHIISRSCEIKAAVVAEDERESGLRAILNFGHTIGHALETVTGYASYLHGEAVAFGMYAEAELSRLLGLISDTEVQRIRDLITAYGLPAVVPGDFPFERFFDAMHLDKKSVAGSLRFVLPVQIGRVILRSDLPESLLHEAVRHAIRR